MHINMYLSIYLSIYIYTHLHTNPHIGSQACLSIYLPIAVSWRSVSNDLKTPPHYEDAEVKKEA